MTGEASAMMTLTDQCPSRCAREDALPRGPAAPLASLLAELADVLALLTDAQYVQKPVGVIPSSVGGHVRHCLDHVKALLCGVDTGRVDYDRRDRATTIETDRRAALESIRQYASALVELESEAGNLPVRVSVLMTSDGAPAEVRSSVGRELAYVLSHTIHHNALLAAMVRTLGGTPPERFGYAPSTIRQARSARAACAR
jgi:uncharacterized damage-inducible protein DinB